MKLEFDSGSSRYAITGYRRGAILINDRAFERSLIVTPTDLITDWPPTRFDELEAVHFSMIAALNPEVVLLGTGISLRFPSPDLTRCLLERRIGLESMDTAAACRAYSILASEGRQVAAALIMI